MFLHKWKSTGTKVNIPNPPKTGQGPGNMTLSWTWTERERLYPLFWNLILKPCLSTKPSNSRQWEGWGWRQKWRRRCWGWHAGGHLAYSHHERPGRHKDLESVCNIPPPPPVLTAPKDWLLYSYTFLSLTFPPQPVHLLWHLFFSMRVLVFSKHSFKAPTTS